MKKIYNKFLIISSIAIFLGGSYIYFMKDLTKEGVVPTAYGSSLSSSNGTDATATSVDNQVNTDTAFLTTLMSLNDIKIDTSLFESDAFNKLQNNEVKIDPVTPGRVNPFAPVDSIAVNNTVVAPNAVTNQPSQVTDKTAVLNGTVNTVVGVTDTYFEYGPTMNLGTVTTPTKPSLVGGFIKNILGLTSKTNYFYKACAKVNNIAICGEVIPFTTK